MPGGAARPAVAVLAGAGDAGAVRLVDALAARARVEPRLVSDTALSLAVWRNGPLVPGPPVRLVHCRIGWLPAVRFALAPPAEQAYAAAELTAVALSWLTSLGARAVNRPTPSGLAGRQRSLLEWLALAARAELPVADAVLTSSAARVPVGAGARRLLAPVVGALPPIDEGPARRSPALFLDGGSGRRALVAGDRVVGGPRRLRALAEAAGCDVLEVILRDDGAVLGADPVPGLATDEHAEAVAELLEERALR